MVDGQVTKIDQSAGKITLNHGPLKNLGMDEGMTMVFRVWDPAMLKDVKVGDKVKFEADKVNGQFTVTKMQKRSEFHRAKRQCAGVSSHPAAQNLFVLNRHSE